MLPGISVRTLLWRNGWQGAVRVIVIRRICLRNKQNTCSKIISTNARSFVLFLAGRGQNPAKEPIEIYGSDPYIVGGHTGSGFGLMKTA